MADEQRHENPNGEEGGAPTPSPDEAIDGVERAVSEVGAVGEDALAQAREAIDEAASIADSGAAPPARAAEDPDDPRLVTFELPSFSDQPGSGEAKGIDLLSDVNLNVTIELGRTRMLVEDVLKLSEGAIVELDKLAGDPVDVYVNERLVARGEVLVLNDAFCIRVNEIVKQGADAVAEAR